MAILELNTMRGNYFLSKSIFKYDLKIAEIRLLLVLTSTYKNNLDKLTCEQKKWISASRREYVKLKEYEKHLIKLGLLNEDGTGIKLDKDYLIYRDISTFNICKNIRQLFVLSLKVWHKQGKVIISEDMFQSLFGKSIYRINENWKRTCDQLNISCSWEKKNNNIYIKIDKENKSSTVEITSVNNESNTINTNEKQHEENKTEKDFDFLNNIGKVRKEEIIVFNGTEFTAEELDEYFRNN